MTNHQRQADNTFKAFYLNNVKQKNYYIRLNQSLSQMLKIDTNRGWSFSVGHIKLFKSFLKLVCWGKKCFFVCFEKCIDIIISSSTKDDILDKKNSTKTMNIKKCENSVNIFCLKHIHSWILSSKPTHLCTQHTDQTVFF